MMTGGKLHKNIYCRARVKKKRAIVKPHYQFCEEKTMAAIALGYHVVIHVGGLIPVPPHIAHKLRDRDVQLLHLARQVDTHYPACRQHEQRARLISTRLSVRILS